MIVGILKKNFAVGLPVDKDKLINRICADLGVSRRTASEYLKIALVTVYCVEETVEGRRILIQKNETQD